MKSNFLLFLVISLLSVYACRTSKKFILKNGTDAINPNSINNNTYKPHKEFIFDLTIKRNDTIYQIAVLDSLNYRLVSCFEKRKTQHIIKKIHLYVYPNLVSDDFPLQESQTIIGYYYEFTNGVYSLKEDITGVMERKNYLFLHPPRLFLDVIEYCPFPELPIPIKQSWETHGNIYGYNIKNWGSSDTTLNDYCTKKYTLGQDTVCVLAGKKINCQSINGVFYNAQSKAVSSADFLFNPTAGFVRMQYKTVTKHLITFNLIKIIQH
jgi:hypothetical protein